MGALNKLFCFIGFTALVAVSASSQTLDPPPTQEKPNVHLAALNKKALAGDTKAELQMGLAYEFGQGTDKNIASAMHWYRIAADKGDPVAQTDLGYLYETGSNGAENPGEAAKWYMRAALSGLTRAKFNLGILYLGGNGVQRSDEEAAHWISEAANDGCPRAILALSYLYENGRGVPLDARKALELKRKAAKKNESDPCMTLSPPLLRKATTAPSLTMDEYSHEAH